MIYVCYDDRLLSSSLQAKEIAVTTVSQLLNAGESVFQEAAAAGTDDVNTFAT